MLHSFDTNSKKGSCIVCPKNLNSSAGVRNIPSRLLITVLHKAVATLPPLVDVSKMHMLIVVGKHVSIRSPSSNGLGSNAGKNISIPRVKGKPIKNGQAPNVHAWIRVFNLTLAKAFVSSDNLRDNPERRKITVTPYFPMNSSGCNMLPFLPSYVI